MSPPDYLVRRTSHGPAIWVSHSTFSKVSGVGSGYLAKVRTMYKKGLSPSLASLVDRGNFLLADNGRSWRWGYKFGMFYYDIDRIPDQRPSCYRSKLPSKQEILQKWGCYNETGDPCKTITSIVASYRLQEDTDRLLEFTLNGRHIFNRAKASGLAVSLSWCRFIKDFTDGAKFTQLGFKNRESFYKYCAGVLGELRPEGMRIKKGSSLRKKIEGLPADRDKWHEYLVSGKYCNDNARKIGKVPVVDELTGELFDNDLHEAVMMNYWLNPGGSEKFTKKECWEMYAGDMRALGIQPVSRSTFETYTNSWFSRLRSAKERHGEKVYDTLFRPYIPMKPLEYSNTLWVADGSGLIPYRYRDRKGAWRVMKLYAILVSDASSRCILGYSTSKPGRHTEEPSMVREAVRSALLLNGRDRVAEFLSDNHGAFTAAETKEWLSAAFLNVRTITPGNSKANPAELLYRLFKRRYKNFFRLPETSWDAHSVESLSNPDHYDPMGLPLYEEAVEKLRAAIEHWNNTAMKSGQSPYEAFTSMKNKANGTYSEKTYRMITGNMSRLDVSSSRGFFTVTAQGNAREFELPTDAASMAVIESSLGYSARFKTVAYWDEEVADLYTTDGVYMISCKRVERTAKSPFEGFSGSSGSRQHFETRMGDCDNLIDSYYRDLKGAREAISRMYGTGSFGNRVKESYNTIMEQYSTADIAEPKKAAGRHTANNQPATTCPETGTGSRPAASIEFHRNKISDISRYKDQT